MAYPDYVTRPHVVKYLKVAAELRRDNRFSHSEMKRRLGYRSINAAWEVYDRLVREGWLTAGDTTEVWRKAPALTPKALRHLKVA
jgi:hypothetical protein